MSRARDIADFNASLFADDEISGDKVSGGTIGAGTFNGTIGSNATFPTGQIIACKQWIDTSGNTTVLSNSKTALNESSSSQNSFSATSGNSYLLSFTGTISIASAGGSYPRIVTGKQN